VIPLLFTTESLNYCPVCGFRFAEKKNEILQHFTTCLAAKFRLEKRQPEGNLRYGSCSISPCVSRPSSGWRNASRGATSVIEPAAFHGVSHAQVQAGEMPAAGQPQV
jgi:predicted  nucleic acid-binding Zn-ribbon protein